MATITANEVRERIQWRAQLRPVGLLAAIGLVAAALDSFQNHGFAGHAWGLLGSALLVAILCQRGLALPGTAVEAPPLAAPWWRIVLGAALVLCGAYLWVTAATALYHDWFGHFDRTWMTWLGATVLLGIGLDLVWGRWTPPGSAGWRGVVWLAVIVLLALAAVYRLGNIATFPGEGYETQIEDVMTGMWGTIFLRGDRTRWEYLSWAWLSGFGIWLFGPTLMALRIPFAVVSTLKVLPIFVWLRLAAGTTGALVGTALFVCSSWDIVLSRIPNNHNGLIVAIAFALLAGPVRRGRPSAYVWLGFFGGYVLYEYIAYRPLAAFVLAGATAFSLRDVNVSPPLRIARVLIVAAMIGSMAMPLFLGRLRGRIQVEYFDGFYRAQTYAGYYQPRDTWQNTIRKRIDRAFDSAGLFFFHGDGSPVHNLNSRPQVDPITATLLLIGIAYGIANPLRSVFGLTVAAFVLTLAGTTVVTGNFDIGRAGGLVPYTYALVGYAAAAVVAGFGAAWGRFGRITALAILLAGTAVAFYDNTTFLFEFWNSPTVRRAMRNNLPYLASWLRTNVQPGEQVVGIVPRYPYVLSDNDAAWLRGRPMPGIASWDIVSALRYWNEHRGKTLLLVFDGTETRTVKEYLESLFPDLHMQFEADPVALEGDIAYAHVEAAPANLNDVLNNPACRGATSKYEVIGSQPEEVLGRASIVAPFVDSAVWPTDIQTLVEHSANQVKEIRVHIQSTFAIQTPGQYSFMLETYAGRANLHIDNLPMQNPVSGTLEAGAHTLEITGTFERMLSEIVLRLFWQGPDAHNTRELMPLYRVAIPDPACESPAS